MAKDLTAKTFRLKSPTVMGLPEKIDIRKPKGTRIVAKTKALKTKKNYKIIGRT